MSLQITPLSEGVFTIGHDKIFVPFDETKHLLEERPTGSLLVEVQPFLVQTHQHHILFDTGLGFRQADGELQLHGNLRSIGVDPLSIDMVVLSHLHKDHAGGICSTNELGIKSLNFPNARYYVSRKEFDFGLEKGYPSYTTEDFDILAHSEQVEWLDDKGSIQGFIQYHTSGGHCPYHQCFLIQSGEDKAFFGGDVVPQLKQLKTRYIAKYDFDGRVSMELRQKYAALGHEEKWKFMFYHDVKHPIAAL
ncbi:MAG: MBL fold metallo-hydrolase [Chitinophagaceae bacterium]|nr:MBL fold metallo-hydrolase [Chitinophagaceae bacterium]